MLSLFAQEQQVVAVVVQCLVGDQARKEGLVHLAQFDGKEDERVGDVTAQFLHLHHQALGALVQVVCREHELCILTEAAGRGADAFFFDHELPELGGGNLAGCNPAAVLCSESGGVPSHRFHVACDARIVKACIQGAQVPYDVF